MALIKGSSRYKNSINESSIENCIKRIKNMSDQLVCLLQLKVNTIENSCEPYYTDEFNDCSSYCPSNFCITDKDSSAFSICDGFYEINNKNKPILNCTPKYDNNSLQSTDILPDICKTLMELVKDLCESHKKNNSELSDKEVSTSDIICELKEFSENLCKFYNETDKKPTKEEITNKIQDFLLKLTSKINKDRKSVSTNRETQTLKLIDNSIKSNKSFGSNLLSGSVKSSSKSSKRSSQSSHKSNVSDNYNIEVEKSNSDSGSIHNPEVDVVEDNDDSIQSATNDVINESNSYDTPKSLLSQKILTNPTILLNNYKVNFNESNSDTTYSSKWLSDINQNNITNLSYRSKYRLAQLNPIDTLFNNCYSTIDNINSIIKQAANT